MLRLKTTFIMKAAKIILLLKLIILKNLIPNQIKLLIRNRLFIKHL